MLQTVLALASVLLVCSNGSSGPAFVELPSGEIASTVSLVLDNESDGPRHFTPYVREPNAKLTTPVRWKVKPRASKRVSLMIEVPRESFVDGKRRVPLYIDDSDGFHRVVNVTLVGPHAP